MFAVMTSQASAEERKQIAFVASVSVAIVLMLATIGGQPLLAFFGITIASFKVGGAILILLLAAVAVEIFASGLLVLLPGLR